ncbi:protein FAM124A-like [Babylonia areolata]|uniref:protein FAM124A-like n=1 Tax=Babylonia areolata TaxID=304850 RepID=UPI003FD56776
MASSPEAGSSKVHLTLHVPPGRSRQMRKLLKPHLRPADPALSLLHVQERESPIARSPLRPRHHVPGYHVGRQALSTPALSLVVFLPEGHTLQQARQRLHDFPWNLHHRIELQTPQWGGGAGGVRGQQEFYSLSRQYPLCALCAAPCLAACTVRWTLFVRNFRAMLHFYRLLTDTEMESSKADFAVFTVNAAPAPVRSSSSSSWSDIQSSSSPSTLSCTVQLALKHCPHLDPYPLTSAYLTFYVRNLRSLRAVLGGVVEEMSPDSLLARDPDGNCVLLHHAPPIPLPQPPTLFRTARKHVRTGNHHAEHASPLWASGPGSSKDSCDSQDSGRFSDSERGSSQLNHRLHRLVTEVGLHGADHGRTLDTDSERHVQHAAPLHSDTAGSKVRVAGLSAIRHGKQLAYL